jgi:cytoskeletal protein RodZ
MKRSYVLALGAIALLGGIAYMTFNPQPTVFEKQIEYVKEVVIEDKLEKSIKEAQEAALPEIEAAANAEHEAALAAAEATYNQAIANADIKQEQTIIDGLTAVADTVKTNHILEIEGTLGKEKEY